MRRNAAQGRGCGRIGNPGARRLLAKTFPWLGGTRAKPNVFRARHLPSIGYFAVHQAVECNLGDRGEPAVTLVAAWREGITPFLVGDLLTTAPFGESSTHRVLPSSGRERLQKLDLPREVSGLRQKVCIVSPQFAVAWAGTELVAANVIRKLRSTFRGSTPRVDDVAEYLRVEGDIGPPHCELVGAVIEQGVAEAFHWSSQNAETITRGFPVIAGSGSDAFKEALGTLPPQERELPFWRGLARTTLLLGNEVVFGGTLRLSFGGGYQLVHAPAGAFVPPPSITSAFVAATERENGDLEFRASSGYSRRNSPTTSCIVLVRSDVRSIGRLRANCGACCRLMTTQLRYGSWSANCRIGLTTTASTRRYSGASELSPLASM